MHLTAILTDALRNNLETIKEKSKEIHKDRYLITFTNHGYEHSERMIEMISSLITGSLLIHGKNKLNKYEVFVLLSSIYLHDIGIQLNKDCALVHFAKENNKIYDKNWPEEKKKEFIRTNHHLLSGYWIRDNLSAHPVLPAVLVGDRELGDLISRVVISHGLDFSIKDSFIRPVYYEGREIRMKLLCELLCLADSLDCDKRRIDYEKLKISETPNISMLHWMKHYYCNSISIRNGQVHIAFQFPKNLDMSQQLVYSTYFRYHTEYWIRNCQERYKKDFDIYKINFTIYETEDYGEKDVLDESIYLAVEDYVVDIVLQTESIMSPKSVVIGILKHDGKVVLVCRKHEEGLLKWQFPAGFIKEKQVAEDRVVEEFENETGIKTRCIRRIGRRIHPDTRVISTYFALEYLSGDIHNLDKDENSACMWVNLDEYQSIITSNIYGGVRLYLDEMKASE